LGQLGPDLGFGTTAIDFGTDLCLTIFHQNTKTIPLHTPVFRLLIPFVTGKWQFKRRNTKRGKQIRISELKHINRLI